MQATSSFAASDALPVVLVVRQALLNWRKQINNSDHMAAPYEADAQLTYLERAGLVGMTTMEFTLEGRLSFF